MSEEKTFLKNTKRQAKSKIDLQFETYIFTENYFFKMLKIENEHYHKTQMKEDIINKWIAGKETKEYANTIFEDDEKYYKNNY